MTTDELTPAQKIRAYLAGNPCTDHHHQSILGRGLKFTDGILYVAETAGAFWLIDAVASYQPRLQGEHYQFWRLECDHTEGLEAGQPDPGPWVLSAWTDVLHESRRLVRQELHSDFPRELSPFDVWVEGGVLLLPEEH